MKKYDLFIDGGTTNTRFTLMNHGDIILRIEKNIGAVNANGKSCNDPLFQAVKDVMDTLQNEYQCEISDVFASGMITSNAGLCEIPHVNAPATIADIANQVESKKMIHISANAIFHFIPGIKFMDQKELGMDIMRGEEVEIFGALKKENVKKTIMFIHFGSHNKIIYYKNGAIQQAVTTLGGELLWAILNHTILKSSIGNVEETFELLENYVKIGYIETKKNGISRSLFLARIHQVIQHATTDQVLSYIYGALMCVDMDAFYEFLKLEVDKLIIYGRANFLTTFRYCLSFLETEQISHIEIDEISFQESEWLSVKGCQRIRNYIAERG